MKVSLIVAMTEGRVMGKDNELPWHLPQDLKRFRKLTTGYPIVMGRKTFESIGRLLPDRENIILTRQPDYGAPGATVFASLDEVLVHFEGRTDELFIIGGAQVYRCALSRVDQIYMTLIHEPITGDVYFPEFDESQFVQRSCERYETPLRHSYLLLERRRSGRPPSSREAP